MPHTTLCASDSRAQAWGQGTSTDSRRRSMRAGSMDAPTINRAGKSIDGSRAPFASPCVAEKCASSSSSERTRTSQSPSWPLRDAASATSAVASVFKSELCPRQASSLAEIPILDGTWRWRNGIANQHKDLHIYITTFHVYTSMQAARGQVGIPVASLLPRAWPADTSSSCGSGCGSTAGAFMASQPNYRLRRLEESIIEVVLGAQRQGKQGARLRVLACAHASTCE